MTPETPHSRLSTDHPEFRYSTSFNPYAPRLVELSGKVFADHAAESVPGQWRSLFAAPTPPTAPLHVEIGCNAGHVTVGWARQNPDIRYVGIDWKFKAIFRAVEKAEKHGCKNALFIRGHAERLPFCFAPGEIDVLHIYFPDPWVKKAQRKNRLINTDRLRRFVSLIKPETGQIIFKTDHREYFDRTVESFQELGQELGQKLSPAPGLLDITEINYDVWKAHPDPRSLKVPEVTIFEGLFLKDGLPIHRITARRR